MNMQRFVFFVFCPQYEGSVNEVLFFFVTNVKTQTFYRIVQGFFSAFWERGESHLSTCSIQNCACLCCGLTEFSDEDMNIYMKITLVSNSRFDYIC